MSWIEGTEKVFFESEKQAKTKAEQECAAELKALRREHPIMEANLRSIAAKEKRDRQYGLQNSATAQGYAWRLQRQHAVVRSKGIVA